MDKLAILGLKKNKLASICEKCIKETHSGCAKRHHLDRFFDYNYLMQMRHAGFSILPQFSVHSASVYLVKTSSDEPSDSEMPYNSSDEEVWEEEEVGR